MNALRYILESNDQGEININIPNGKNKKFEVIVLPAGEQAEAVDIKSASYQRMKLQQETGFVRNVIGSKEEDVWNELI